MRDFFGCVGIEWSDGGMCGIGAALDACEVCVVCWMPVRSGACGKKYSAGGVCML